MREPIDFAGAWMVEHADLPAHLTLAEWGQQQAAEQRAVLERAREARRAQRRQRLQSVLRFAQSQRQVRHG